MITKNVMQLKAFVKKKAIENQISQQLVMQNYILERFLERISLSKYNRNFILKGGFLIAAIVGLDTRATMDMDTTVKGLTLTHGSLQKVFEEICAIVVDDNINFTVSLITNIREGDEYNGLRVHLIGSYQQLAVTIKVDVTTGDKITPKEIEYSYKTLFDEGSIPILAYNLETIIAEKLETVLSRNIANTRPRDFYDIHILCNLRKTEYDVNILQNALNATATKRGSISIIPDYHETVNSIRNSAQMQKFWIVYQDEFSYAKNIEFSETCDTIIKIMDNCYLDSV